MVEAEQNGERDDLAAEYVLGTLDARERAEVELRRRTDADLAAAIAAWERRLDPLLEAIVPIDPPADVFGSIVSEIAGDANRDAEIIDLKRHLRSWRRAAVGFGAIAASLLAVVVFNHFAPAEQQSFVAVLESGENSPAFVASVNLSEQSISIQRIDNASAAPAGHSHELWAVGGGNAAPQSLGVINSLSQIPVQKLGHLDRSELQSLTFAVSVEPEGGSPTGQPTGPVVFSGKLVPVPGNK